MTTIQTKAFTLRPLQLADAIPYFETMQDKETRKNLMQVPSTLQEAKEEIRTFLKQVKEKDSIYLTVEVKGAFAGNVILQHQNYDSSSDEGRIHLWIHPKYRRQGLATQALKVLLDHGFATTFKRIFAQCKATNKGVIKLLNTLGFQQEKTHTVSGVKKILWVKQKPCPTCEQASPLTLKTYTYWRAELSDSFTPIGWTYIVLKRHEEQFEKLHNREIWELKKIIAERKRALTKAFNPDWFNVMQLGNRGRHLHIHLVPRYKHKVVFSGRTFTDPDYGKMLKDRYKPCKDKQLLLKCKKLLE